MTVSILNKNSGTKYQVLEVPNSQCSGNLAGYDFLKEEGFIGVVFRKNFGHNKREKLFRERFRTNWNPGKKFRLRKWKGWVWWFRGSGFGCTVLQEYRL